MKGATITPSLLWVLVALVLAAPARATAQNPEACRTALTAQGVKNQGANPCNTLAVLIATTSPGALAEAEAILKPDAVPVSAVLSQRDLQARRSQQAALGGTPAQGDAIPDVHPAGVAAGTIAALGTSGGGDAIAALSVNPGVLFLGQGVSRALARRSRFADITVFVPVSGITTSDGEPGSQSRLRYFGARLRVNVNGLSAGNAAWSNAETLIRSRISRIGRNVEMVSRALAEAPDLAACATALLDPAGSAAAVVASCGRPITLQVDLQEAEQIRAEFASLRRQADARYLGVDIRVDVGDPTLDAAENASGTFLFAGVSGGRRIGNDIASAANVGLRGRLGVRHAKLDEVDRAEFAAEGGFGIELARQIDEEEINASAGIEFRWGGTDDTLAERFQTNFVMLRGTVLLPLSSGNSLSINFGAPVAGSVSPVLSVNFNWGLLLPDRPGVR